jgi:branched-chain amino acid transport system permease protein
VTTTPDISDPVLASPAAVPAPGRRPARWRGPALAVAAAALVPPVASLLGGGGIAVQVALLVLVYAGIAQCWNLVIGFSGIFSVAQLTLFGIGAYTAALTAPVLGPWLALPAGGLAGAVASLLVGLPVLRMAGVYVALLTLALNELVHNVVTTGPAWLGRTAGLTAPPLFTGPHAALLTFYTGLALVTLLTVAVWRIVRSPVGMGFQAMRDSPAYAGSRGLPTLRIQLFLFAYSSFLTGVVGAFFAAWQGVAAPSIFDFDLLFTIMMAMVLGGWSTLAGPIGGVAFLVTLTDGVLRDQDPVLRGVLTGIVVIAVVVCRPTGLVGMATAVRDRFHRYLDQFID